MTQRRKLQILVIDDSEIIKSIISQMLKGHYLSFATTAKKALKEFDLIHPDIVFVDINLPDENGIKLLKEMKEKNSKVHVIMLTGSSALRDVVEAMNNGASGYVVKPFSKRKLEWIVDRYIINHSETEQIES